MAHPPGHAMVSLLICSCLHGLSAYQCTLVGPKQNGGTHVVEHDAESQWRVDIESEDVGQP